MSVASAELEPLKPAAKKRDSKIRKRVGRVIRYLLLILVGLAVFTPFILAFLGSFKTGAEIIAFPPTFSQRCGTSPTGPSCLPRTWVERPAWKVVHRSV